MGCFSYLCKECGKGILSNSFRGEQVKLFYLKDGKVIEEMEGEYDSYGRVFIEGTQREDVKHPLKDFRDWQHEDEIQDAFIAKETSRRHAHFSALVSLHPELAIKPTPFNGLSQVPTPFNNAWGIAAVHSRCFKEIPTSISENDPDQGWGEGGELFADIDSELDVEKFGSEGNDGNG